MPKPPKPSRRETILDQTFALVQDHGISGLTIRRIAEKVGVTEGALYRHFPSKEAILVALAGRIETRLLGPIREIASEPGPPADRLTRILRHHLQVLLSTRSLPLLLVGEASFSEHAELKERLRGIISSYLESLEGVLAEVTTSADRRREIAVLAMGLPAALAIRHRLLPDPELEGRLAGAVVDDFVTRLLAEPLTGRAGS